MKRIYALYKGDEYIIDGTRKELAKFLKVKEKTISFYMTPAYAKRGNGLNRKKVIFIGYE